MIKNTIWTIYTLLCFPWAFIIGLYIFERFECDVVALISILFIFELPYLIDIGCFGNKAAIAIRRFLCDKRGKTDENTK